MQGSKKQPSLQEREGGNKKQKQRHVHYPRKFIPQTLAVFGENTPMMEPNVDKRFLLLIFIGKLQRDFQF